MENNTKIQVQILRLTGKTTNLEIQNNDSILQVKEKIFQIDGYPAKEQRLTFKGQKLEDEKLVNDYGIKSDATLHLLLYLKGGGVNLNFFLFNKMENAIKKGFSSDAPDYRIIRKGLNIEAICQNNKCEAYDKKAWSNHKFGDFNIARIIRKSLCPICKEKMINANNIGFYLCQWEGEGSQNNKEIQIKKQSHEDTESFHTFQNDDSSDQAKWDYLDITVQQLKEKK